MINVTFKLRSPKNPNRQMIYLVTRFGRNDKLVYTTLLKVRSKHWNTEKMRVRDVVECIDRTMINNRLNEFQTATESYITTLITDGQKITKEALRGFLDNYTHHSGSSENKLHQFIADFLVRNNTRINPKTGKIISYKVSREHERTYFLLKSYENEKRKGKKLDFEDITLDFYEDFTEYLQNYAEPKTEPKKDAKVAIKVKPKRVKKGLSVNTIAHKIQTLKTWLNDATDRGINTNQQFKSNRFKAITEETENIYLTTDELVKLYDHDFKCERLERVRDLFLIGAFTGLRFSDFTSITDSNIQNSTIRIEQHKTGKPVSIPLHPIVAEIWRKYNNSLPDCISNQKFNDYIKEACELAGIDNNIQKGMTTGGMRVRHTYKKYELIGSHTARRSFATNLYLSGFPALSIMQITGHQTETAFMKYIKVTSEQHANLLRKHWAETGEFMRVAK